MSYENNNVKAGANGAGVYVGSTEIMGGGVNNIIDNNYTAPCKVVVINVTNEALYLHFAPILEDIELQPNEVVYKGFDSYTEAYLSLPAGQYMNGRVSYGYTDGSSPEVSHFDFTQKNEIQFMGDSEEESLYICIISRIIG